MLLLASSLLWLSAPGEPLPDAEHPLRLYSNQSRHNLQKLFSHAISEAKSSLFVMMYALTDARIVKLLAEREAAGIQTQIFYDPSATPAPAIHSTPLPVKGGLMHRKILVTDQERSFVGSANFTTTSLKMHDNLVAGFYHPGLAQFMTIPRGEAFSFSLGKTEGEFWLLPSQAALSRLTAMLHAAKKQIYVAMFTLTHPELVEGLIAASKRGVDVRVAIDHYTAEGASAPVLKTLRTANIPIFYSQGQQLFHHKWAWIDRSTLILGSANWTRAAFTQNQDCLLILRHLKFEQKRQLKKIWNIIEIESTE